LILIDIIMIIVIIIIAIIKIIIIIYMILYDIILNNVHCSCGARTAAGRTMAATWPANDLMDMTGHGVPA